jgi:hypothetical protein
MNKALDYVSIKSEIGKLILLLPIALNLFVSKDVRKANFVISSIFLKEQEQNITNLIIDLSYNTGGDERLGKQLIWYVTEKNPRVSRNI